MILGYPVASDASKTKRWTRIYMKWDGDVSCQDTEAETVNTGTNPGLPEYFSLVRESPEHWDKICLFNVKQKAKENSQYN